MRGLGLVVIILLSAVVFSLGGRSVAKAECWIGEDGSAYCDNPPPPPPPQPQCYPVYDAWGNYLGTQCSPSGGSVPAAPNWLYALSPGPNTLRGSWTAVAGATAYVVSAGGVSVSTTTTFAELSGVPAGQVTVTVRATNASGSSPEASYGPVYVYPGVSTTPPPSVPPLPPGCSYADDGWGGITVVCPTPPPSPTPVEDKVAVTAATAAQLGATHIVIPGLAGPGETEPDGSAPDTSTTGGVYAASTLSPCDAKYYYVDSGPTLFTVPEYNPIGIHNNRLDAYVSSLWKVTTKISDNGCVDAVRYMVKSMQHGYSRTVWYGGTKDPSREWELGPWNAYRITLTTTWSARRDGLDDTSCTFGLDVKGPSIACTVHWGNAIVTVPYQATNYNGWAVHHYWDAPGAVIFWGQSVSRISQNSLATYEFIPGIVHEFPVFRNP